jgi:D-alanyl-D-alanine carboxypeptidase
MAKDANAVVPIASLTKLVTAMVVLDADWIQNERLRVARADLAFGMQDNAAYRWRRGVARHRNANGIDFF